MLAIALTKIGNDIRLMGSGPRAGFGELQLPANEPGSSIMPGKVNPTQVEALTMVCAQVMGHDAAIGFAASQGHFELNVYKPLIALDVLDSLRLLADAMYSFSEHCASAAAGRRPRGCRRRCCSSLMLVTALAPHIGYARAAQVAQLAHADGSSLREAALALGAVSAEQFDRWVDARQMLGRLDHPVSAASAVDAARGPRGPTVTPTATRSASGPAARPVQPRTRLQQHGERATASSEASRASTRSSDELQRAARTAQVSPASGQCDGRLGRRHRRGPPASGRRSTRSRHGASRPPPRCTSSSRRGRSRAAVCTRRRPSRRAPSRRAGLVHRVALRCAGLNQVKSRHTRSSCPTGWSRTAARPVPSAPRSAPCEYWPPFSRTPAG
jgi:hypothetical protein